METGDVVLQSAALTGEVISPDDPRYALIDMRCAAGALQNMTDNISRVQEDVQRASETLEVQLRRYEILQASVTTLCGLGLAADAVYSVLDNEYAEFGFATFGTAAFMTIGISTFKKLLNHKRK